MPRRGQYSRAADRFDMDCPCDARLRTMAVRSVAWHPSQGRGYRTRVRKAAERMTEPEREAHERPTFSACSLLILATTEPSPSAYPDEPCVTYVFDTDVANGRYIAQGDLAVLRDSLVVLGVGWIDDYG